MARKASILVVEDEEVCSRLILDILAEEGFAAKCARSAFVAESMLRKEAFDLVILDRRLPDKDGIELCRELRQRPATKSLPVLFLTAKKGLEEKVSGLRIGGDDYITKPFEPADLVCRVQALLRRSGWNQEASGQVGSREIRLDLPARKAFLEGREVELWRKEYDLLQAFLERPGRALSRQFLLESVWDYRGETELNTKVVDVTVGNLRRKLGAYGEKIVSVKGIGYRFDP